MLTVTQINSLTPKKSSFYAWDKTGERGKGRLGVQVTPAGSKSFKFRYFQSSKAILIPIGRLPGVTLAKARKIAESYSELLSQGIDPLEYLQEKEAEQEYLEQESLRAGSFEQLIDLYTLDKCKRGKRNYEEDKQKIICNIYPYLDKTRKAKSFEPSDFMQALSIPIQEGYAPKSNKLRSYLHAAFEFGLKNDNDPASNNSKVKFGLKYNPISAIPKQTYAEKAGDRFLNIDELVQLIHDMSYRYHDLKLATSTRRFIKLCFYLGGQRPYEIANTKWSDINFRDKTLTIRAEIFKTNHAHVVPLTHTAVEILKECLKDNEFNSPFVFHKKTKPTEPMPSNTLAQALLSYKRNTEIDNFIARDFRRTFKTLGGQFKISKEVRDRIQGHAISDVSGKHYDRYEYLDEKRDGLELWEAVLNERLIERSKFGDIS
ncbi:tyrosine-type recombinase/integrase [Vibrio chagasii]|uniref:Tyrosine-type recombinase/integrase n=2 Tax=Vibrio TaxID=662 RepID=A0A7V7TIC9_9VIBR|nr:site-specific integrase [Vibrio chagasii]KAB0479324.1 tyrosine-type recombinase/integrase [Vibrio chagasii]